MERFNGKGDFGFWCKRMRAILIQQKVVLALNGEKNLSSSMSEAEKEKMLETAYSIIILYLSDNVLRQVSKETTAEGIWMKLESLYMTKSLTNRIYLKAKFFGFKMQEDKSLDENLDEFNKIVIDLENMEKR